jgi:hypothetical protein
LHCRAALWGQDLRLELGALGRPLGLVDGALGLGHRLKGLSVTRNGVG